MIPRDSTRFPLMDRARFCHDNGDLLKEMFTNNEHAIHDSRLSILWLKVRLRENVSYFILKFYFSAPTRRKNMAEKGANSSFVNLFF